MSASTSPPSPERPRRSTWSRPPGCATAAGRPTASGGRGGLGELSGGGRLGTVQAERDGHVPRPAGAQGRGPTCEWRIEPPRLFVYGTLQPGRLRWPFLEPFALAHRPATVAGRLYDSGKGWPAAVFERSRRRLDPRRRSSTSIPAQATRRCGCSTRSRAASTASSSGCSSRPTRRAGVGLPVGAGRWTA